MVATSGKTVLPVHIFNDVYSHISVSRVSKVESESNPTMLVDENDGNDAHAFRDGDPSSIMSVLILSARKPHISIVDKQMSFKPGTELFPHARLQLPKRGNCLSAHRTCWQRRRSWSVSSSRGTCRRYSTRKPPWRLWGGADSCRNQGW